MSFTSLSHLTHTHTQKRINSQAVCPKWKAAAQLVNDVCMKAPPKASEAPMPRLMI